MDPKKLTLCTIFLIGLSLNGLFAQQVVSSAGGTATGSGGSVNYTAGQIINTSLTGIGGSIANGVQLPFEILIGTGIKEASDINLEFTAYPNPVTEFLHLNIQNYDIKNLSYQVYDIHGKLLFFQKIKSKETSIPMDNLPSATYFLKIIYRLGNAISQKDIKTFIIIKN
jgi:hypothetical protein